MKQNLKHIIRDQSKFLQQRLIVFTSRYYFPQMNVFLPDSIVNFVISFFLPKNF